jgi:hypothetical protein
VKLLLFEMYEKHQNEGDYAVPLPNLTQRSGISICDILTGKIAMTLKFSKNTDFYVLCQMTVKIRRSIRIAYSAVFHM